jgi:hypothetical protein
MPLIVYLLAGFGITAFAAFAGWQIAHFLTFVAIWIRRGGDAAGEFLYPDLGGDK